MIEIRGLVFRYGDSDFSLEITELDIPQGEQVAVVGPSGSGKTTLLNLVAGIAKPRSGRVVTGSTDLSTLGDSAIRDFRIRNIGLVFQEFELLEYLTVLDNVLLPYRINRALELDAAVTRRAMSLLDSVGIADKAARYPGQLSQGEKQRAAVCRALLAEPSILLADEPTGNLDVMNKGRVLEILLNYARDRDATLVTVTHDTDLVERFGRTIDFREFLPGASEVREA